MIPDPNVGTHQGASAIANSPRISVRPYIVALLLVLAITALAAPKREFRGAWIQTIYQGYEKRSTAQNKAYLSGLLDDLQAAGINAVFFQVRPCADAFYKSNIEPWSAFLTGEKGKAPAPEWDPLSFIIDEAHARGLELHAWLNPYRADRNKTSPPTDPHLLKYGKAWYFDPSQQDNRDLICRVVADIVSRYDIDGIHFDDYFYPYPIAKLDFPDAQAYAKAKTKLSLADWRRHNVNLLIEQVSTTIAGIKPWVRFGISPFGIWRNSTSHPAGSKTRGLQNYDDLYADTPLWAERGWIDYQIPQLYWELDHKLAPYRELAQWWAANGRGRHIYIGQDAEKTSKFNELDEKMKLAAATQGSCWWYAASLALLTPNIYHTLAIVPEYAWKEASTPEAPADLHYTGGVISWRSHPLARKWVVYRFNSPAEVDIENPAAICAVTYSPSFLTHIHGTYVVTALSHSNCESSHSAPITI